jgi:hypothetical protein
LYRNLGKGLFADVTYRSRVGAATSRYTGWSVGMFDFDNDGRKDIFAANGELNENAEALSDRASRQPNIVLAQRADGTFDAAAVAGGAARHRGAAFADFDNDGRVDVVVSRLGEGPLVLRNVSGGGNHWLGVKLEGTKANRDGAGAVVRVKGDQWNQATTAVGYASSSDIRVHFGLGAAKKAVLEVRWPGGGVQEVGEVQGDQWVVVREK